MSAPYSENARVLLQVAVDEAKRRNHSVVGTEHAVFAMCRGSSNRAVRWIARTNFPDIATDISLTQTCDQIVSWLDGREGFQSKEATDAAEVSPTYSQPLQSALKIAEKIGSGPIRDGDELISGGIVATEFILAGIIVEGSGIGSCALTRLSKGKINSSSILRAIQVDPDSVLLPKFSGGNAAYWSEATHSTTLSDSAAHQPYAEHWYPEEELSSLMQRLSAGPPIPAVTSNSNWLIPGKLLIGEHPSDQDAASIKDALVATSNKVVFVSLIGEYTFSTYVGSKYPKGIIEVPRNQQGSCATSAGADTSNSSAIELRFMHFPIRDFEVAEATAVVALVGELKKLLFSGAAVFLHCRGGHGRTGMVVIPLLAAVFDVSIREAQEYVVKSTQVWRKTDKSWARYVEMPETEEQCAVMAQAENRVRKHTR